MSIKLAKSPILVKILFVIFLLTFPQIVCAQNSDNNPYLINNVFVSATGKNAVEARASAVEQARRNAFSILLGRLSIDEGFNDTISSDELSDMVQAEQITNEKIAGNNYSASFNIGFSESFVTNILSNKNISKSTSRENNYLIIPIKNTKKKELLWEANNDWKQAWEAALKQSSNSHLKIPKGDADDANKLNVEMVDDSSFENFEPLFNKYKSDAVIVIYFNFDELENKVSLLLKTIRKFQTKQIKLSFVNVNQLNSSELLSKVTEKTIEHILSGKDQSASGSKLVLDINIPVSNLGDWMAMKDRLEALNFLEEMVVNSIAKDMVKITVKYDKNNGDLADLFAKNNFSLKRDSEGQYLLFPNS